MVFAAALVVGHRTWKSRTVTELTSFLLNSILSAEGHSVDSWEDNCSNGPACQWALCMYAPDIFACVVMTLVWT